MRKLYKSLLAIFMACCVSLTVAAQQNYWELRSDSNGITKDKLVTRASFPRQFKLFQLNNDVFKNQLYAITDRGGVESTVIYLPNTLGEFEKFQVFEASNFEPALQFRFPAIRAFSGRSLSDPGSLLKISIAPSGIQTMVFRTNGRPNEFIEAYSADHTIYAVFVSEHKTGTIHWNCSTPEQHMAEGIQAQVAGVLRPENSDGKLRTMRLAQSCTGEYANFFGATTAGTGADQTIVLTAFNNTMTRCNGVYEKDLALHLNLIANTTAVIFYNPATDPYATVVSAVSPPASWNGSLQTTLTNIIGEAYYDIGHLFGASGGGGNAGCIGCVCEDGQKGSGITSPATGSVNPSAAFPPAGDGFDIDYVVHEVGHQLGANHTFSHNIEPFGVNKEVGSGITIMGYAGITSRDVAPHSIDVFHQASIQQIQNNLATKACPVTTSLAGINATPVVAALTNYTIPPSTPFALTGTATDADAGDILTYCWEQNDDGTGQNGANSVASETKLTGPNWITWPATISGTRLLPRLSTILTGANLTGPLPGGDAGVNIEALSSVSRTLNFRLTVRDNRPFNGTAVGQTNFQDMTVTVNAATYTPFLITSQNTTVSYAGGSTQTLTWSVGNTTAAPISTVNVKISWSTDNGNTFTTLIASTPNDGSEAITIPTTLTTQGRVKVEAVGNIFFDINNSPITVTLPANGFTFGAAVNGVAACPAAGPITATVPVNFQGTYAGPVTVAYISGAPAGTNVTVSPSTFTANGTASISLNGTGALVPGTYNVTIQGTGPAPGVTQNLVVSFTINPGAGPVITTQPVNTTVCAGANATFTVAATGTYQWQFAPGAGAPFLDLFGATNASITLPGVTAVSNGSQYRCIVRGQCGSTTSDVATLTVNVAPVATTNPVSQAVCSGSAVSFTAAATGTPAPTFQWQVSTAAVPSFTNIAGATNATLNLAATTLTDNGNQYRCVITNACGTVNTNAATLTVNSTITVATNPVDATVCEATNVSFTTTAAGSGLNYQWEVSVAGGAYTVLTNGGVYAGATSPTLLITGVPPSLNGNRYRCVISNGVCTPGISTGALLTVNTFPAINTQPANVTICESAGATFSAAATTGVGTLSYQWQLSTDGGTSFSNIAGATTSSFAQASVPVGQNGYRFRVIVTAGCGSVTSNAAVLTVNAFPVINFLPVYVVCKSDAAFSLSATPAGGVFSGAGVSGSTFTPSVAGNGPKAVTYTATNAGCVSAITRTIQVNECNERHLTLNQYPAVIVYPVPNNGTFGIRLNTDLYSSLNVKVFNSMGQLVKSQVATGLAYGNVINVTMPASTPSGTYQLYLSSDSDKSTKGISVVIYR
ncbi:MAG: M12 family metallo-peptidase [Bacteroidetes bacterium]|nr:M12 family metallo-peptidase [Bacteroidota bacterium]